MGRDEQVVGRASVLHVFDRFRRSDSDERVIVVWGEPGTGKSYLLRYFAKVHGPERTAVVDLDAVAGSDHAGNPVRSLLDALASAVAPWAPDGGRAYFDLSDEAAAAEQSVLASRPDVRVSQVAVGRSISNSPISIDLSDEHQKVLRLRRHFQGRLQRVLVSLLRECDTSDKLLLIDGFERITSLSEAGTDEARELRTDHYAWLTDALLPEITRTGLRIVVAGWNEVPLRLPAHRVRLAEWSNAETDEYLVARGMDDQSLRRAVRNACGGHPSWTALVADAWEAGGGDGRGTTLQDIETAARHAPTDRWLIPFFLNRLPERQRVTVTAAAVLREITVEAVTALVPVGDRKRVLYPDWAQELFGYSFVRRSAAMGSGGHDTWRYHPLIRTALLQHYADFHDEDAIRLHHNAAEYYRSRGHVYEEHYHRFASGDLSTAEVWLQEMLAAERQQLTMRTRILVEAAIAPESARRLADADPNLLFEAYFAGHRTYFGDPERCAGLAAAGHALALAKDADLEIANFSALRGVDALRRHELDEAGRRFDEALRIFVRLRNAEGICMTLEHLGWLAEERDDKTLARRYYLRACSVAESSGKGHRAARALSLVTAMGTVGDADFIDDDYWILLRAVTLAGIHQDHGTCVSTRVQLADRAVRRNDRGAERIHLSLALDAAARREDEIAQVSILLRMAMSYEAEQEWDEAGRYALQAVAACAADRDGQDRQTALTVLVRILLNTDLSAAGRYLDELDAAVSPDQPEGLADLVVLRDQLALAQDAAGNREQFVLNLWMAGTKLAAAVARGEQPELADLATVVARKIRAIGEDLKNEHRYQALGMTGRILISLRAVADATETAHGYLFLGLAKLAGHEQDAPPGQVLLEHALTLFGPEGDIGCRATAHSVLGQIHLGEGRDSAARDNFAAAARLWTAMEWAQGVAAMNEYLARLPAAQVQP
jgi:hypothetical protein